jgi:hypothetical protein
VTVTRTIRDGGRERIVGVGEQVFSQAIAVALLVDAATSTGLGGVSARSLDGRVTARVASGGFLVLIGSLALVRAIAEALGPLSFDVELRTAQARTVVTLMVPAASPLPVAVPDIALTSGRTAVSGAIRTTAFLHAPIAGAEVTLRSTVPAGAALGLRVGPSTPHAAGTTLRPRPAPTVALTTLDGAVTGGDGFIRLTSVSTVAPGVWLLLEDEYAEVVSVETATRLVQLRHPLLRTYPDLNPVLRATLGAAGAPTTLGAPLERGDSVVVTAAPVTGDVVEIVDGVDSEVCLVGVESDAAGTYRFGTVRGLANATISAAAPGFTTGVVTRPLDPARPNHVIDVRLAV